MPQAKWALYVHNSDLSWVLEASWKLLSDLVLRVVKEAEASAGQAGGIDLGGKRAFTVAEALVPEAMFGPRFAATVAEAVCLEPLPMNRPDSKIPKVTKEAKAIRFDKTTSISITNYPKSPVFARQPKPVRKGTAAALAEAAAVPLSEHEAARRVGLEMAPAAFDRALELYPLAEGRAKGAAAGNHMREGMVDLSATDAARVAELGLSLGFSPAQGGVPKQGGVFLDADDGDSTPPPPPEDDVPEPPVFGVVAAAAANERRAQDVRMPPNKPDLPKEPGGGAGLIDGEDFSGGRCSGWGAGCASSRRRRLDCCRTSPRAAARPS